MPDFKNNILYIDLHSSCVVQNLTRHSCRCLIQQRDFYCVLNIEAFSIILWNQHSGTKFVKLMTKVIYIAFNIIATGYSRRILFYSLPRPFKTWGIMALHYLASYFAWSSCSFKTYRCICITGCSLRLLKFLK